MVIAAGPFQKPRIPSFAGELPDHMVQFHLSQYKNTSQLKKGPVLVVRGGNSGAQIAVEVSEERETFLSVGQNISFLPQTIANISLFWWMEKIGILKANRHSFVGKIMQKKGEPIIGYELKRKLKNKDVTLKGRTIGTDKDHFIFEDQSTIQVQNVIWATGFVNDYSWLEIPGVLDAAGRVQHERGITNVEGLYFLGLPWQYRRGSALLMGVGEDAKHLYRHITRKKSR